MSSNHGNLALLERLRQRLVCSPLRIPVASRAAVVETDTQICAFSGKYSKDAFEENYERER